SWDATTIDLHVPVARMAPAIAIMGDVVTRPTFPEKELARLKEERLAALLEAQDDPEELIQYAFPRILYCTSHPYGTGLIGTASGIGSITAQGVTAFHKETCLRKNQPHLIVVTGDVTSHAVMPLLEKAFHHEECCAGSPAATPSHQAAQRSGRAVYL